MGRVSGYWRRFNVLELGVLGLFLFLSLNVVFPTSLAWAHGGGVPQLTNAEAGPYWVSVWTQPDPLRVGEAHITVAVSEPGDLAGGIREPGAPVLNAAVQLLFEPVDGPGEARTVTATHEGAANRLYYEADMELTETGRWNVAISIDGPSGTGETGFDAQVSPPRAFNWAYVIGLGLAGVVVVGVVQRFRDQGKRV
jgi:hypothetical protein